MEVHTAKWNKSYHPYKSHRTYRRRQNISSTDMEIAWNYIKIQPLKDRLK
jgi:hypothetical protein